MDKDSLKKTIEDICRGAKEASYMLAASSAKQRTSALLAMADALSEHRDEVLSANQKDLASERAKQLTSALRDRLELTAERFEAMVQGLKEIAELQDPLGHELQRVKRPNGLSISKVRAPIGLLAVIYESRPNVTADAAGLCIKSGNAVVLRGGSEAKETNSAIAQALRRGLVSVELPAEAVIVVPVSDRDAVRELVQCERYVDLVIPRGGESLIRAVSEMACVPVLKHYKGVCHIYVHQSADLENAVRICDNAKTQRPGVCNAVETVLVDREVAAEFLPMLAAALSQVELRGDPETCRVIERAVPAEESDWEAEYLDLILAVKVVDGSDAAIAHINSYGSGHTEAIIAQDDPVIEQFLSRVDSGVLMVNASTRFNDGSEFGKGAEIGISTDKIHARGPVGVEDLTTYKYVVRGNGQVR